MKHFQTGQPLCSKTGQLYLLLTTTEEQATVLLSRDSLLVTQRNIIRCEQIDERFTLLQWMIYLPGFILA